MPGLTRAYAAILDADFEEAARLLAAACPPAPEAACLTLEATRRLWRIQLDPERTADDASFTDAAARAVAAAEAWASREPDSAEAWFYVGGAYGARVQWKALRRQHVSAARDGKRAREALDRALALDPRLDDAQLGIGLYEYYAAVAPTGARILRVLLLLPGGDRARGLQRMGETRTAGVLLADESLYQLHLVNLWYENRPQEGLTLARTLVERHPRSPFFRRLVAETLAVYLHDCSGSLASYRELEALAEAGRVNEGALARAESALGIAAQLEAMGDTDLAVAELEPLVASQPAVPWGADARARLALAQAHDRLGDTAQARRLYQDVIRAMSPHDPLGLVAPARRGLARPTPRAKAEAHRIALAAWRQFERDAEAPVASEFERALALDPDNHVARYRQARVLIAAGAAADGLAALERVLAAPRGTPPTIVGAAALAAARVREQQRDLVGATRDYRRAAYTFGAAAETRDAAARALARLDR